jgi:hypothetical protein
MARVSLSGGAYTARSVIAGAQRCVNLYAEINPDDAPVKRTYYPRPGLRGLSTPPTAGAGRGLFRASSGLLYAVVGWTLYAIGSDWAWTRVGDLASGRTGPVSMEDNGVSMLVVDGSTDGFVVDLATNEFSAISSAGFQGGDRVGFLDTFFVLNRPDGTAFYSSLGISTTFDPLYFAAKIGYADKLASLTVMHREIWLFGERTSEIWVNSGGADFPFEIMTGAFIAHGCAAKHSVATIGEAAFWLSADAQGQAVVLQGGGYQAKPISTPAVANAIGGYSRIDDAVAMTFQLAGHQFYVLTFPTADKTWAFDVSSGEWSEFVWVDGDGAEHRHRAGAMAFCYGEAVALDWETGALYAQDLDVFDDDGDPVVYRRGFPHMTADGDRVIYTTFVADMEVGTANASAFETAAGADIAGPALSLRWSDTKGASWNNPVQVGMGATGQFYNSLQFQRLGMARDRVFELFWSAPVRTALNGAWIDSRKLGS